MDNRLRIGDYRLLFSGFNFIPFENGCVLFNETEQSVLILNHTAAFIWSASFEVNSMDELIDFVAGQFDISEVVARRDVEQFFDGFKSSQLFLIKEDPAGSFLKPVAAKPLTHFNDTSADLIYLSVNHNAFKISVPPGSLREELVRILTHFLCSPDSLCSRKNIRSILVVPNGESFSIFVDKRCVYAELPFNGIVPFLFGIIFETIWQSGKDEYKADDRLHLMFHAAVLGLKPDKMLLFPGVPGAGKSTLAAVLAAEGWHFFSDELAFVLPQEYRVLPCPLPVCVKQGAVSFLSDYYPAISSFRQHHRLDDKVACYLPLEPCSADSEADISAIVFPRYDKDHFCTLQPLAKAESLEHFLECGSAGRPMNIEELTSVAKMIEDLPCYRLIYSDTDAALEEMKSIVC